MKCAVALALILWLAGPAAADTLLHLSDSARVMLRPDELTAALRAEAEADTAAEAQAQVNTGIARAVVLARQTPGLAVTTGEYGVWPRSQDAGLPGAKQVWHASQVLGLRGGDGIALLTLVGALQQQGLAVSHLEWQVTPETARHARAEATRQALGDLRARAEEAAGILGLRFDRFREIWLDPARPFAVPVQRTMAATAAAPFPSAEAEEVPVEASVEADAVLK